MSVKRAVVLAGYSYDGHIFKDIFSYLEELRKYSDFIVAVYDNNALIKSDVEKLLSKYADICILNNHKEYDFGSYKRGYFYLKEKGILNSVDKLILCNDSVIFQGRSLERFFRNEEKKDFYGFTSYKKGMHEDTFEWDIIPHVQSYFLSVSKEIFLRDWFEDFMKSIEKQKEKYNVVAKYEIGISKLVEKHGFQLSSFYPMLETEPCRTFLARFSGFHKELEELYLLEKRQYAIAYERGVRF